MNDATPKSEPRVGNKLLLPSPISKWKKLMEFARILWKSMMVLSLTKTLWLVNSVDQVLQKWGHLGEIYCLSLHLTSSIQREAIKQTSNLFKVWTFFLKKLCSVFEEFVSKTFYIHSYMLLICSSGHSRKANFQVGTQNLL